MRIAAAVKWYELGKLSQGKAAEVAGLTRAGFIDALSRFKVSPMQFTAQELSQELAEQNDWQKARAIFAKAPDVEPDDLDKL